MALADIKIGKTITEIKEGDSLSVTEIIEMKDILLYLGLTNDDNPLYVQYDYSQETKFKKPLVPPVLLMGIITSNISKHLPGPGSNIVDFSIDLLEPIHHNITITFEFLVKRVDERREQVTIHVEGLALSGERLLESEIIVETPPQLLIHTETENSLS